MGSGIILSPQINLLKPAQTYSSAVLCDDGVEIFDVLLRDQPIRINAYGTRHETLVNDRTVTWSRVIHISIDLYHPGEQ